MSFQAVKRFSFVSVCFPFRFFFFVVVHTRGRKQISHDVKRPFCVTDVIVIRLIFLSFFQKVPKFKLVEIRTFDIDYNSPFCLFFFLRSVTMRSNGDRSVKTFCCLILNYYDFFP